MEGAQPGRGLGAFFPGDQPVVFAQPPEPFSAIDPAGGPADEIHAQAVVEQGDERITAKAPVAQEDVAAGELAEQRGRQRQFRDAQAVLGQAQDRAAEQGEEHHQAHHGKAGFVGALERWVGGAVFARVGHGDRRAVQDLEGPALELGQRGGQPVGGLGGGAQGLRQLAHGQARFGAAIGAIFGRELGAVVQLQEGLELTDDLAAGGAGIEPLPEQAPEGTPAGVVAVPAVFLGRGLGEQRGGHPGA